MLFWMLFWMLFLGIYEGKDFSIYNLLIFCLAKTQLARWHLKPAVRDILNLMICVGIASIYNRKRSKIRHSSGILRHFKAAMYILIETEQRPLYTFAAHEYMHAKSPLGS